MVFVKSGLGSSIKDVGDLEEEGAKLIKICQRIEILKMLTWGKECQKIGKSDIFYEWFLKEHTLITLIRGGG